MEKVLVKAATKKANKMGRNDRNSIADIYMMLEVNFPSVSLESKSIILANIFTARQQA